MVTSRARHEANDAILSYSLEIDTSEGNDAAQLCSSESDESHEITSLNHSVLTQSNGVWSTFRELWALAEQSSDSDSGCILPSRSLLKRESKEMPNLNLTPMRCSSSLGYEKSERRKDSGVWNMRESIKLMLK